MDYEIFKNYISDLFALKCKYDMFSFLYVQTTLGSLEYELGFDPFNCAIVLLYIVILVVLYLFSRKLL